MFRSRPCVFSISEYQIVLFGLDSAGWVIKSDTTGNVIWRLDSTYRLIAADVDPSENITYLDPQWSEVICIDSGQNYIWTYVLPYTYTYQMVALKRDKNGNRTLILDFNDATQTETRGVGLVQVDSNGMFTWDTVINEQTTPDEDLFVDVQLDHMNNIYVLSKDLLFNGSYVTKIQGSNGNILARNQYVPNPTFRPSQLAVDTLNGFVYICGRMTGYFVILKYDLQLNALDTMLFSRQGPDISAIAINEYGYLFHMWVNYATATPQLQLEMYNAAGQLSDMYSYWDTTRFSALYPHSIIFDSLGNIFASCQAMDTTMFGNEGVVFKFNNPLALPENDRDQPTLQVFPNPASDFCTISFDGIDSESGLRVLNLTGQTIYSAIIIGNSYIINTEEYPNGVYFIEVITDQQQSFTQKLIINHQ